MMYQPKFIVKIGSRWRNRKKENMKQKTDLYNMSMEPFNSDEKKKE